jgi:predicted RNA binding protein YcfA (HicA-like mRNA interferase family)
MTESNTKNGNGERLGTLRAREIHSALRRMRFDVVGSAGDKYVMKHEKDGRTIRVKSERSVQINKRLLGSMLRDANIDVQEFLAHL